MKKEKGRLKEVALLFFKLGCIAFGGPAAHIAMMEDEVVRKRQWMDRQHFLDLVGVTNLIPGPNSTEMTMHCGRERAGWPGLFVAGACFLLPAVAITGLLAWLYVRYGQLPAVAPYIYGIKPAVLAIIANAVYKLGAKALKSAELGILGALTLTAALLGMNEIYALLLAGATGTLYFYLRHRSGGAGGQMRSLLWPGLLQATAPAALGLPLWKIFVTFLKVGAVLYGSGYVLFAYLDAELVARGWLGRTQLMDAIAAGQFTPGPVLSTATFVGYQLGGWGGAAAATAGIFLPSFIFVLIVNPLVGRIRRSRLMGYFLDSVNVASVAVLGAVLLQMGYQTLSNWQSILIAVLSFALVFGFKKLNALWIVIGGALLGRVLMLL